VTVEGAECGFDERQLRDLSETFMAFVGPTYSNFRGQRATLDPHHPIEKAVQELTAGKALKVKGNPKEIWSGLERLQKVQIRRPRRVTELPRPTGRVLRDFYMALQVRDACGSVCDLRASAQKELQYLINQHCLDTLNLLFLQVQLLETDQDWKGLLNLPELPKLMQIRRPSAVTQALLTAIYRSELQQFEERNNPKGAITHFREQIFPNYNPLLTVRAGSKRPEVLKLLMLSAVAGEPTRPALRDELLAISNLEPPDYQYLQELATFLSKPTPPPIGDELEQAEGLINAGEYDRAFTVLSSLSPNAKQVSLLLQCAYELQTLEAESQAISAFYQLEERDRVILESSPWNQNYLAQLQGNQPTETTIPNNWLEWLQLVKQTPDWERAVYTARQGAEEWDVVQLLTQPGQIREFVQLLSQVKAPVLHEALPYLLKSFQSDRNFPRREFSEIYYQFVLILADNTEGGDADLELLNQLVDNLFSLGINQTKYTQLVNQVLQLWTRIASPKKIDWALNFLDLLALHPCPVAQKREEFFHATSETLDRFSRRVEQQQWETFRSLAKELQVQI
jgi:hypothetical protein